MKIKKDMHFGYYNKSKKTTEVLMASNIQFGFLLLLIASKFEAILDPQLLREHIFWLITSFIFISSVGFLSYFIRKKAYKTVLFHKRDATEFSRNDMMAMTHGSCLFLLAFLALLLPPASMNFLYILMSTMMTAAVGLNTYFLCFWRERILSSDDKLNLEALKLQHAEWAGIFNNICLTFIVTIFAVFVSYFFKVDISNVLKSDSFHPRLKLYIDSFLICYCILAPPIIWLLRPVHETMARIRSEIISIQSEAIKD